MNTAAHTVNKGSSPFLRPSFDGSVSSSGYKEVEKLWGPAWLSKTEWLPRPASTHHQQLNTPTTVSSLELGRRLHLHFAYNQNPDLGLAEII